MRSAPAQLGDDAGDARQDLGERRAGGGGDEHVSGRDAGELAFAVDHACAPRAPAYSRGVAAEPRMIQPDLVGHLRRADLQRPRLQQLDSRVVERPFDLDRSAHERFGLAHKKPQLSDLLRLEAWCAKERARKCARAVRALSRSLFGALCLEPEQVAELGLLMRKTEALMGGPVEIEWALDDSGIKLLQARPLQVGPAQVPDEIWLNHPRLSGHPAGIGWGTGRACVINCE